MSRFTPPSTQDVSDYFSLKGCIDHQNQAEMFIDFYESKGWLVGKAKMVSWEAAVRNWIRRMKPTPPQITHAGNSDKSRDRTIQQQLSDTSWAK